jgi:HEAT repeat protein
MLVPSIFVLFVFLVPGTPGFNTSHREQTSQATQRPAPSPQVAEGTELTNGWALLTEGKADLAIARADRVLAANPRSVGAFVLAIEAELQRGASSAALARYDRWLGGRTLEEPSVLRRIATGVLREASTDKTSLSARLDALRALAEDGDAQAAATLQQGVKASNLGEARVLARLGDEAAIRVLLADIKQTAGRSMTGIEALGESGSSLAVAPITEQLTHGLPEIRAAAAEALGKLGTKFNTASRIKPLLSDSTTYVRYKAAAALFALGDMSGLKILQDLASQESPAGRLMAAQGMASRPDAEWQQLVRPLLSAPEPEVRVGAARLLLPHQPALARPVLDAGMNDANPAIRELASESLVDSAPSGDLRALRQLLKATQPTVRVRAAARVLSLLR